MRVLGVDPGLSGAWALVDTTGLSTPRVGDLPVVEKQIDAAAFFRLVSSLKADAAIVELVGAMPRQGVSSTFVFGRAVGAISAVLACAGLPTVFVTPTKWKKHFALPGKEKEKSRQLAIQRWPSVTGLERRKDEGRAEALLLALYYQETKNAASS